MSTLSVLDRDIGEEIRAGLPPPGAAGLEGISLPIERFRFREIDAHELVSEIDPVGHLVEERLRRRIEWLEAVSLEGPLTNGRQRELAALRASWRWLSAFPCWGPAWSL